MKYDIVVSNIGIVYSGDNEKLARSSWNEYVRQSRETTGRASGETVTFFENDKILCESDGNQYLPPSFRRQE